jgi:hypothetical protein
MGRRKPNSTRQFEQIEIFPGHYPQFEILHFTHTLFIKV